MIKMNDTIKISVLMIYYDHWGKDEINARKIVYGVNRTMDLLEKNFHTEEHSMLDGLKRMFSYLSEDSSYLWSEFVNIFLHDYGGCVDSFQDELYDEDELLFDRKIRLDDHLNQSSEDTGYLIYDQEFGYQNVLSVDAIIALL